MIPAAVLAGVGCLAVVLFELVRHPGEPFGSMRVPVAGVWAAAWLMFGINLPQFPSPSIHTLVVLAVTCLGSLLMCPAGRPAVQVRIEPATAVVAALSAMAVVVVAWDLYFAARLVDTYGLTAGLSQHRLDRGVKAGAWALPGIEVWHAAITANGALGYACYRATKRRLFALAAGLGLLTAILSTGRWDVVGYAVWLIAIHMFTGVRRGMAAVWWQAAAYAVLGLYFVGQGQVFGKLDSTTTLANATADERRHSAMAAVPTLSTGAAAPARPAELPPDVFVPCPRWEVGAVEANAGFRDLNRVTRMMVLYFAGPLATLDRALCENRVARRIVLTYWPRKILRTAGLLPAETLMVVDPFLDIGIPFNNYTVIYQFLSEIGPRAGLVAWLALGLAVGGFGRMMLVRGTLAGIVAGAAPLAMAVRTPWNNTFFDGTLAIWIGIALLPAVFDWVGARQRRRSAKSIS